MSTKFVLVLGLFLHLIVAIWNGFFGPSFGADIDAVSFHDSAVEIVQGIFQNDRGYGVTPYVYFLAGFYSIFGSSIFLASLLSVLAWWWGASLLIKTLVSLQEKQFETSNWGAWYLALSPSVLMITSVQLREAYQFLFLCFMVYGMKKIMLDKKTSAWGWVFLGAVGAGTLHGSLMASCVLIAMVFVLMHRGSFRWSIGHGLFVLAFIFLATLIFQNFSYDLGEGLIVAVANYQAGVVATEGRSNYLEFRSYDSIFSFIAALPFLFLQYNFEPFPWKVSTLNDAILLLENTAKGFLLVLAIKNFRASRGIDKTFLLILLISYVICEGVWSLGTGNWGAAARHHIPALAFLISAASIRSSRV